MRRVFVSLKSFWVDWIRIGMTDDELSSVETFLLEKPEHGALLRGTKGIRKLRWSREGMGKRGGARVFYLDVPQSEKLYFLAVIAKNESENLSPADTKMLADLVSKLKGEANEPVHKTRKRTPRSH